MDARHEFFHAPGEDAFWSESHYLDVVGDALQAQVRIGAYPNRDLASVFAFLTDGDAIYAIREPALDPAAVHGTTVTADGLRVELLPIEVGRDWRVRLDGTARRYDAPAAVLDGEGEAVPVECEFASRARHEPFLYSEGADWPGDPGEDRYEVAARVEGEATIGEGGTAVSFEGPGERDHSWGRRVWTEAEWLWISGSFADGTAYNHLSAWLPGDGPPPLVTNGFWFDGETVHPLTDADVAATPAFGVETARRWIDEDEPPSVDLRLAWDGGSADLAVEPFATTPVDWTDAEAGRHAVLTRSPARQTRDGAVSGRGFLENMTQLPLA